MRFDILAALVAATLVPAAAIAAADCCQPGAECCKDGDCCDKATKPEQHQDAHR